MSSATDPFRGGRAGGEPVRWPGMAGAASAVALVAYAHLAAAGTVDPVTGLVGDYALLDASAWAMTGGTIILAVSTIWVAYGLARVDPARSAAARVLLVAGALGLLLTAVYPAEAAAGVTSAAGTIHNWAAAVVSTALPCAGWMLGRRFRVPALSAVSAASAALLVVFLVARPGSPAADLVDGTGYYGLAERLLMIGETALVFLAARSMGRRPASGSRDVVVAVPAQRAA
ncbi:DUF998 domain-containing protein [Streptosporangium sp. NBC_01756]|uniref:DUF998 domain-containing protein n=1 Tax=Streptosporangium sp. NBC_01756 TaxID=2975950 RepID=UPI002DD79E0E|nr:DUF998 domain-containing protein [Streptosporangium sp. NBC_01756]WSC84257.1 DUF998 domain-containing protein [Streptosporangium sp. NBC_01756]